jgi:cytochrome P450
MKDGLVIPAGTNIHYNIVGVHINNEQWVNPDEFIPERF